MADIRLTLLGGFDVTRDGTPISQFGGVKVRALLAYLAVEPDRPHARGVLAALLWPDLPDSQALNNLSQTLARLRGALGAVGSARIHATRQDVAWHSSGAEADVAEFTRLAGSTTLGDLERTAALYGGEFLAGFGLSGCEAFEEWLLLRREQSHQLALNVFERLAGLYAAAARWIDAAAAARRQLALDPWREEAHRQLMRALAAAGDRGGALAAYERCRATLLADLGVEPDAATTALAEQLRREQATIPAAVPRPAPVPALPAPLTPLVGREGELAALDQLLRGAARLVTLLGPGGVGKTRLALAAATSLRDAFADGACWAALAGSSASGDAATQADGLASTILAALELSAGGGRAPRDVLRDVLRQRSLLLILDNCEHLPAVGPFVAQLLTAAPGLRVLVTSRERLGVYGEELLVLDGLPLPDEHDGDVAQAAAVQLFVARARRHVRDFAEDPATLMGVARLCRVLEGMPLGIELAAHWAGDYSPDEIARAVQADLAFLETRDRSVADRHRSLRAVWDYSWRRLSVPEQRALARLSVFAGGFDRPAALQVAEVRPTTLAALVDTSLLRRMGAGRYSLHELLRQFAAEQLDGVGEERAAVETRHGAHYLAFLAERGQRMWRDEPREAAGEIRGEIDNVRQAWWWAITNERIDELERSANGLYQFYAVMGHFPEREQALAAACQVAHVRTQQAPDDGRARGARGALLAYYAAALAVSGRHEQAVGAAQQAIALGRWNAEGEILAHFAWGRALHQRGQLVAAREHMQRALSLAARQRRRGSTSDLLGTVEGSANTWLAMINTSLSEYDRARANAIEALQFCRAQGRRLIEVDSLRTRANIERTVYNLPAAREYYERALRLAPTMSSRLAEGFILFELGDVVRMEGDHTRAFALTQDALAVFQEIGAPKWAFLATTALVRLACTLGDNVGAAAWFAQANALHDSVEEPEIRVAALRALVVYAQHNGDKQQALRYAEQACALAHKYSHRYDQAAALLALGHAHAALHHADSATAYGDALELYTALGNAGMAAEAQAGLAACALADGRPAEAGACVATVLETLDGGAHLGTDGPFGVYATCYRVLAATGDSRAEDLLRLAVDALERQAALIDDPERRRMFVENGAGHQALMRAASERGAS